MGCGKYVGRVGALAVALGVGGVIANSQGVAWADSEGGAQAGAHSSSSAGPAGKGGSGRPAASRSATKSVGSGRASANRGTGTPATTAAAVDRLNLPVLKDVPQSTSVTSRSARSIDTPSVSAGDTAFPQPAEPSVSSVAARAPQIQATPSEAGVKTVPVLLTAAATAGGDAFSATPGRGGRPQSPLLAAIWGFVRRVERTWFNQTPATDHTTAENVQVDARHVVGYLDPTDADDDAVTYTATTTKGGTIAFDPNTAGQFTYTAPDAWDGATVWSDSVTFTVSDAGSLGHVHGLLGLFTGGGHNVVKTATITVAPGRDPVVNQDGSVSGSVLADNDTLTYTLEPNSVDTALGMVSLDTASGQWTFTPSEQARSATSGPATVTFTILAGDGEHITPISFTAPITHQTTPGPDPDPNPIPDPGPGSEQPTIPLPGAATVAGQIVTGEDGSVVQASYDQTANKSYVTIVDATGTPRTSAALPGSAVGDPVPGPGGKVFQQTFDESDGTTYLSVVGPTGATITVPVPGEVSGRIIVDSSGRAFLTSVVAAPVVARSFAARSAAAVDVVPRAAAATTFAESLPTPGSQTFVTMTLADGTIATIGPIPGIALGDLVVGANGTAYQTTYIYDQPNNTAQTYVSAITSDGHLTTTEPPISGIPQGQLVVGPTGTAYQAGYDWDAGTGAKHAFMTAVDPDGAVRTLFTVDGMGANLVTGADGTRYLLSYDDVADQSFLVAVSPDEDVTISRAIPGSPIGAPAVTTGGAVYQTTTAFSPGNGWSSHVTTFGPDGTTTIHDLPGDNADGGAQVDADGFAYQASVDYASEQSYITVVKPDGTVIDSLPLPGVPNDDAGLHMSPGGNVYLVTDANTPAGAHLTYVVAVGPDGTATVSDPLPGSPVPGSTLFGPDGTAHLTSYTFDGAGQQTYVTTIGTDGIAHTKLVPGQAFPAVLIDSDGVVYQTTVDDTSGQTFVTVIKPDGTTLPSFTLPGAPSNNPLVLAPDGTVYLTTNRTDPATGGREVYVATVFADGSVRAAAPVAGDAPQGVVIGADGTVYQNTGTKALVLDPSSWTLHRPPATGTPAYTITAANSQQGTVTGLVNATDPDGDALGYSGQPNDAGTLVVNPATGGWTFTPSEDARAGAYYGTASATAYFTILVTDGDYVLPISVTAPVSPAKGAAIALPPGATPSDPVFVAADGTTYQTSYNSGSQLTYLTVIRPDGSAYTNGAMPGGKIDHPFAGASGRSYLLTINGSQAYFNVVGTDGGITTVPVTGQAIDGIVVGADGTGYLTSFTSSSSTPGGGGGGGLGGNGGDGGLLGGGGGPGGNGGGGGGVTTYTTYVTVVDVDGISHLSSPIDGLPNGVLRIAPDGSAFLTTATTTGQTYVTVLDSTGGSHTTGALAGAAAGGVLFASNGAVYQSTYSYGGPTYVTIVDSMANYHTSDPLTGQPTGQPLVDANGNLRQTTQDSNQTYLYAVDSTGAVVSLTVIQGVPANGPVLGSDGTLYQTVIVDNNGNLETFVAVIQPGGTVVTTGIPGTPRFGMQLDQRGGAYQVTSADPGTGEVETYLTRVDPNGTTYVTAPLPGVAAEGTHYVTSAGVTYQTTSTDLQTYVTVVGTDGVPHTTPISGAPYGFRLVVGADGSVYQTTVDQDSKLTYVTVIRPDGGVGTSTAIAGLPVELGLVIAPDGSAYQTTYSYDAAAGTYRTRVFAVGGDGVVRSSGPLSGSGRGGVVTGGDGTLYQTTELLTSILNPATWS